MDLTQILQWFASGAGRPMAAAVVFALIFAIERVPVVGEWLGTDAGVSARVKKLVAGAVLSLAPAALLLATSDTPVGELAITAIVAVVGSTGLNAWSKMIVPAKVVP